jgi:hypothetical protein
MSKLYLFLAALFLVNIGCTGQAGPAGPSGTPGTPAANTIQASFQNGVYPVSSYSGELDTWLNGGAGGTIESASPYLEVNAGASSANYARTLLRFDVTSLPVNASIATAELLLKTETATNVGSSPVTIGVHNLASNTFSSCHWTSTATWINWGGGQNWSFCTSDVSLGQEGYINPTTVSTVVFTSANNGLSQVFKWSIDPAIIKSWLTASANNNGLILKSEGEFGETVSAVAFYPYNDATALNHAQLVITYQ